MSDLAHFQRDFFATLKTGKQSGVAVHRNTGARALADALAANYPVVRALFGETAFAACAFAFVSASPPRDPRLSHYGGTFAAFLAHYAPAATIPWVADIAALERLWRESLMSADAEPADGAALADMIGGPTGRGAVLGLHPAVRIASFSSPAASIWRAHQEGGDEDIFATIAWGPERVLVTRPGDEVRIRAIDSASLIFLETIAAEGTMLDAAIAAAEVQPDANLAILFAGLIEAGAFALPARSFP